MKSTRLSARSHAPKPLPKQQDEIETQDFVISRISTLNVLLKRRAAIYARRNFDFTLTEWRIITLLRTLPPISVRELALEALADTALISRAAAGLVAEGYLVRKRNAIDSREAQLSLTPRGMKLSKEMCRASLDRNAELLQGYSDDKIKFLVSALDEMIIRAREMVALDESAAEQPSGAKVLRSERR
jgi:DNA-binding MarR family transcriptional regulator